MVKKKKIDYYKCWFKSVEIKDLEYQLGKWHETGLVVIDMKPGYTCGYPNGRVICWVVERDIP